VIKQSVEKPHLSFIKIPHTFIIILERFTQNYSKGNQFEKRVNMLKLI